jgi:hypothetical protein
LPARRLHGLGLAFLLLILAQAGHSLEEYVFRLYDVLAPARFASTALGVPAPLGFAIANTVLVAFGLWCWFAQVGPLRPAARALAWSWAILELLNAAAHTLLAIAAGGYFPGLYTVPLLLAAGAWLVAQLVRSGTPNPMRGFGPKSPPP